MNTTRNIDFFYVTKNQFQINKCLFTGADPGGADPTRPKIGKNMIFWRKIVIFHTKYPKKMLRLPPLGAIFLSVPP